MSEGDSSTDEWPPPEARVRSAVWRAEGELERGEYFAASRTLEGVFDVAGEQEELVRGLHHLAAAGYKAQTGEPERARRQLARARRRLEPYPETAPLIRIVERSIVESARGELA
jgi:hypothetical protein